MKRILLVASVFGSTLCEVSSFAVTSHIPCHETLPESVGGRSAQGAHRRAASSLCVSQRNSGVAERTADDDPVSVDDWLPWPKAPSGTDYVHNTRKTTSTAQTSQSQPFVGSSTALASAVAVVLGAAFLTANHFGLGPAEIIGTAQNALANPTATLERVVEAVSAAGPLGIVYFGIAYTLAEILAIPAIPLTASAGYLFGPVEGTAVVLVSASIAAAVSFLIGRTLLREYVEGMLDDFPDFAKIDKAIGKEGFKLMLLLRLSPVFPFALSNYLYGASSINFTAFFWGTLLGFAPGTMAYVYTGYVGKALTTDGGDTLPWYIYLGGLALFTGAIKTITDIASSVVDEIDDEE